MPNNTAPNAVMASMGLREPISSRYTNEELDAA